MDLVAIYHCGRQTDAAPAEVLSRFRDKYPACAVVMSETAEFLYKTTDYWAPEFERSIAWNDSEIAIEWPFSGESSLSGKDKLASTLATAEHFA